MTLLSTTEVKSSFVVDVATVGVKYVEQLIVSDSTTTSPPDTVIISTDNLATVANAGIDKSASIDSLVTLDGSLSSDINSDKLTYKWSLVSIPGGRATSLSDPAAVKPTFVVDVTGVNATYVAQLTVNDGLVNSAPDTVSIGTLNSQPIDDAGLDMTITPGQTVSLDGSGSFDSDLDTLLYNWFFISVTVGSLAILDTTNPAMPTFEADKAGTYVAQLVVSDGALTSLSDSVVIKAAALIVVQRARSVITATTTSPVATAIIEIPGGGTVYALDNIRVRAGQP